MKYRYQQLQKAKAEARNKRIADYWRENPDATSREVGKQFGVSATLAAKVRKDVQD